MTSRRAIILGAAGLVTGGGTNRLWAAETAMTYSDAERTTWAPIDPAGGLKELVRAATLAANNHNVQPWTFRIEERRITIMPDMARRLAVVDPDDHHLFVSLGCATQNVVQAAGALGLKALPKFDLTSGTVTIVLEPTVAATSDLTKAISARQSSRCLYDGKPVAAGLLKALADAGGGEGHELLLLTDQQKIDATRDYIIQGNTAQIADRAFVKELKSWLRFNESEALATRDGLFSGAAGSMQLPSWIAPMAFDLFFSASSENDKYAKQIASSAGIAVFASARNDKAQWVDVGRAVQRFSLTATALGLRLAFLNQPVEVASIRPQFAAFLGIGTRRPDIVMRFGSGGPDMPRSLRRAVEQVIL